MMFSTNNRKCELKAFATVKRLLDNLLLAFIVNMLVGFLLLVSFDYTPSSF